VQWQVNDCSQLQAGKSPRLETLQWDSAKALFLISKCWNNKFCFFKPPSL
jgi:hypothetical protein